MDLRKDTLQNEYYRKVVYTVMQEPGSFQLVEMALKPGQEIGLETHHGVTQFIYIEKGEALAIVGVQEYKLHAGGAVVVPPDTPHNIIAKGKEKLKLFTIYTYHEHEVLLKQKYKS